MWGGGAGEAVTRVGCAEDRAVVRADVRCAIGVPPDRCARGHGVHGDTRARAGLFPSTGVAEASVHPARLCVGL